MSKAVRDGHNLRFPLRHRARWTSIGNPISYTPDVTKKGSPNPSRSSYLLRLERLILRTSFVQVARQHQYRSVWTVDVLKRIGYANNQRFFVLPMPLELGQVFEIYGAVQLVCLR